MSADCDTYLNRLNRLIEENLEYPMFFSKTNMSQLQSSRHNLKESEKQKKDTFEDEIRSAPNQPGGRLKVDTEYIPLDPTRNKSGYDGVFDQVANQSLTQIQKDYNINLDGLLNNPRNYSEILQENHDSIKLGHMDSDPQYHSASKKYKEDEVVQEVERLIGLYKKIEQR